jgi:hypothetical protein
MLIPQSDPATDKKCSSSLKLLVYNQQVDDNPSQFAFEVPRISLFRISQQQQLSKVLRF